MPPRLTVLVRRLPTVFVSLLLASGALITGPSAPGEAGPLDRPSADPTGTTLYLPLVMGSPQAPSDLEVTQAVQQPGNPVRLLANRPTFVRYTLTSAISYTGVSAYLHATRDGTPLAGSPLAALNNPRTLKATADRSQLNDTFNFQLPLSWASGSVEMWGAASNGTTFDIVQGVRTVTFSPADPMGVTVLPIAYTCTSGGAGTVVPSAPYDYLIDYTFRIYPVPSIQQTTHVPIAYSGPCTSGVPNPVYGSTGGDWVAILNLVTAAWRAEGSPNNYYYGLLDVYCAGSCIAGIGWVGGSKAAVGFTGFGASHSSASSTHAHEVGHNHGRWHAPGCGAGNVDAAYPYHDTSGRGIIGDDAHPNYGLDLGTLSIKIYPSTFDVMTYCSPEWVSDYTYEALWAFDAAQAAAPPALPSPSGTLVVSGRIAGDGSVELDPAYRLDVPARPPEAGDYRLELVDSVGMVLEAIPFGPASAQGDRTDGEPTPSIQGFSLAVPYREGVERLRVLKGDVIVGELGPRPKLPSPSGGAGEARIRDGELQASWPGQDGLNYLVRISTDGGSSWQIVGVNLTAPRFALPLSPSQSKDLTVEVYASDGIHTTRLDLGRALTP